MGDARFVERGGPRVALAANNGDIGGGEVMLLLVAEALRSLGIGVSVVGPSSPDELVVAAAREGHDVIALRARDRPAYMAALAAWRRRHRGVPLWCHGLVPATATSLQGPRIVHLHQVPAGPQIVAADLSRWGARTTLVPSSFAAGRVPGATVLENWTADVERLVRTGRTRSPVRIGFLGRLTVAKGVVTLARAMRELRRRGHRELRLVLAGANRFGSADDDRAITGSLAPIEDITRRTGWIARRDFFAQVDLAVFPSIVPEPFGLVAAEAMAAGVPFVVSDAGALPDVAGPGHPWMARSGDAEHLADTIERALADLSTGAEPVVDAARTRWERRFSPAAGRARVARMLDGIARER